MRSLVFFVIILLPKNLFAQELLTNGSFEAENTCTEYEVNCAPEGWISSSSGFNNYFKDADRAYDGGHLLAVEAGHTRRQFERTFIRTRLLCTLLKGHLYRLHFFIKSPHALLDSVGVYFGVMDPLLERKPIHRLSPSVFLGATNQFRRDSGWQQAVVNYTAGGGEAYLSIANFSKEDVKGLTGIPKEDHFFFFLDSLSLVPLDPTERLCSDWQTTRQEIYDQNERHGMLYRSLQYHRDNGPLHLPSHPMQTPVIDTLVLPDVLFASGRKELEPAGSPFLDSLCHRMTGKTVDSVYIEGHTDNTGTAMFNEELSRGRAGEVGNYLMHCAAFFRRPVRLEGRGSRNPVAENDNADGRRKNRRVVIIVYTHG